MTVISIEGESLIIVQEESIYMRKLRLKNLKIRTEGTPCLHMESKPLLTVSKQIIRFAGEMINAMAKKNGVGISAPQVGRNIQLCAIIDHKEQKIVVMINPRIVTWSTEKSVEEEGCLSCPGKTRHIERSNYVVVDYVGIDGSPAKMRCDGITARIVQHELDHLEGTLITDHVNANVP